MSRPFGHRDRTDIPDRIITQLTKTPGMTGYAIAKALQENNMTIRTHLGDLIRDHKIIGKRAGKVRVKYYMAEKSSP